MALVDPSRLSSESHVFLSLISFVINVMEYLFSPNPVSVTQLELRVTQEESSSMKEDVATYADTASTCGSCVTVSLFSLLLFR